MPMSSKKARAFARVRAIAFALSAVSFVAVLFAPLSAFAAAPTISGTPPASVTVGSYYNFQPAASDPDGDPLTFSIQNKPSWLVFYPDTGRLGRTATAANVGTYSNIVIRVSDGVSTAALPAFSITVRDLGGHHQPATDDQPHATRQCDSGLVLQLPARGFRSRRRPAHVLDPEQAELAGVLSRHRQAREDGDRRERRDLFEHHHQRERRQWRPPRCPHSRSP